MILFLRGVLLAIALFLLANAAGSTMHPYFDQSVWLTDLRTWPNVLRSGFMLLCAVSFGALAIQREPGIGIQRVTLACLSLLFVGALWQTYQFYRIWKAGQFTPGVCVPLTACFATGLAILAVPMVRGTWAVSVWSCRPFAAGVVCVLFALPLCQMLFFGTSDYRRSADAIVVLGARAYADGRLSDALADRMRTAIALYHEGRAPLLIVSGGPGDGAIHETEAMRDFAVKQGVPSGAIFLDRGGVNTEATAHNVATLSKDRPLRVLAVSHAYHLPRVKMSLEREGVRAWTVPARERYTLRKMPLLVAREVVALWAYYFRLPA